MSGMWLLQGRGEPPPARGGPAFRAGDVAPRGIASCDRLAVVILDGVAGIVTLPSLAQGFVPLAETGSHLILDLARVRGLPVLRGPRNVLDPCRGDRAGRHLGWNNLERTPRLEETVQIAAERGVR